MEIDSEFITFSNVVQNYINTLADTSNTIKETLSKCQDEINSLQQTQKNPKPLRTLRESFFTDTDGNRPTFFSKENTDTRLRKISWNDADKQNLQEVSKTMGTLALNKCLLQIAQDLGFTQQTLLLQKIETEKQRLLVVANKQIQEDALEAQKVLQTDNLFDQVFSNVPRNYKKTDIITQPPPPPTDHPPLVFKIPMSSKVEKVVNLDDQHTESDDAEVQQTTLNEVLPESVTIETSPMMKEIIARYRALYNFDENFDTETIKAFEDKTREEWVLNMTTLNKFKYLLSIDEYIGVLQHFKDALVLFKEMLYNEKRQVTQFGDGYWRIAAREVRHNPTDCKYQFQFFDSQRRDLEKLNGLKEGIDDFIARIDRTKNLEIDRVSETEGTKEHLNDEKRESFEIVEIDNLAKIGGDAKEFCEKAGISFGPFIQTLQKKRMARIRHDEFSKEEDKKILEAVEKYGRGDWVSVSMEVGGRDPQQCLHRYEKSLKSVKKGRWSKDEKIRAVVCNRLFPQQWSRITNFFPDRVDTQVRDFLCNSSRVGFKTRVPWTKEEDETFIKFLFDPEFLDARRSVPKWSKIEKEMVGRTDCQLRKRYQLWVKECKNCQMEVTQNNLIIIAAKSRTEMKKGRKKGSINVKKLTTTKRQQDVQAVQPQLPANGSPMEEC
ncbi:snap190, putative [Entamoeba invadens IP1]|uniref:Snap190, putative n=1 Tax=Entamoeba invadens IP1 TaxID=370355 RepID=A0A0A1U819_ENTIV|nr:snap190, putative [Entamoeba invadens IP1]ELP91043.1 snap190, putative [Entamoeba invadens IP1]|eukprot:XP_004257814.1 snap190, putative [Entamoeba invadens IP1]